MSVTVCWSVKGGSGTTVVAAAIALASPIGSTLVDLDGELPTVLGLTDPPRHGIAEWLQSDAPATALVDLAVPVDTTTVLVPSGVHHVDRSSTRWPGLVEWLRTRPHAVIDAGTGVPPPELLDDARSVLVTRGCFLALRRAALLDRRPDGIVLLAEPGRSLGPRDVAHAIGAPVIAVVSVDPAVARAVDAGLLTARLPHLLRRELRPAIEGGGLRRRPLAGLVVKAAR